MRWYEQPVLGSWPISYFMDKPLPWASIPEGQRIAITWPAKDAAATKLRIFRSLEDFKQHEFSRYEARICWTPRRCVIERRPNAPTAERTKRRFHFRLHKMKVGDKQSRRLLEIDRGDFHRDWSSYIKRLESRLWAPPQYELGFTPRGVTITRVQ